MGYLPSVERVEIYIVTNGCYVPLNLRYVLGGGWPILGYLPSVERVEIYIVTDGLCAFANLGCMIVGRWPISAYPPPAGRVDILYGYGLLLRPGEFRIRTWQRMADFGCTSVRRDFTQLPIDAAPR